MLPADKQNIVYTNRRSRETQGVLDKILKAPEEIKVDKTKEQEAERNAQAIEARTGRQPRAKTMPAVRCSPNATPRRKNWLRNTIRSTAKRRSLSSIRVLWLI